LIVLPRLRSWPLFIFKLAANMPIRHATDLEHYLEGFRRAGLR